MKRSFMAAIFVSIVSASFADVLDEAVLQAWPGRDDIWMRSFGESLRPFLSAERIPASTAAYAIRFICSGDSLDSPADAAILVGEVSYRFDRDLRRGASAQTLVPSERAAYRSELDRANERGGVAMRDRSGRAYGKAEASDRPGRKDKEKAVKKAKKEKKDKEKKK